MCTVYLPIVRIVIYHFIHINDISVIILCFLLPVVRKSDEDVEDIDDDVYCSIAVTQYM